MGSLVAQLARRDSNDLAVAKGLDAAPHRGTQTSVVTFDRASIGVSNDPELVDAWVTQERDLIAGVCGDLDELSALARVLEREGHPPLAPEDPSSVVCAAWRAWGEDTPTRLRGSYAIAVSEGRRVWSFRDHVGYRALFYRADAKAVTLASEPKQVVATAGVAAEPDLDVLEHVFFTDYDDETPAALRGVWRLPKARLLRGDDRALHARRYWFPERLLETAKYDDAEVAERFDDLMTRAVARGFRGDDAVALSGGIDSPAIAAYGAAAHLERYGTPLAALTATYPNHPTVDETGFVRGIAQRLDIPLHLYDPHAWPTGDLQRWARLFDGLTPVFSAHDAEAMFVSARERGYRHLLGGFAAELVVDMRQSLLAHLLVTGRGGHAVRLARLQLEKGTRPIAVARQLVGAVIPRPAYAAYRRRVPPRGHARVPDWVDIGRVNRRAVQDATAPRRRWWEAQLGGFRGPGLSVEANEVVQEVCGVRLRRSWTDVDLWEFFLSLPAEQKFPDVTTKGLVRRLLRGRVPDEVLDRSEKTVFNDSVADRIDHADLRRWLGDAPPLIPGVDYDRLAKRLADEDMGVFEYLWARDLASIHAFIALWDR
jgi:asparagine synthase (glutamine-hydrolysing)